MNIKNKLLRRAILFLATVLLLSQFNILSVTAEGTTSEKTIVIAGSDFQSSSHDAGAMLVGLFLKSMTQNNGITSADGFLFCGDYARTEHKLEDNLAGLSKLKGAVSGFVPEENMVFAQGNHDCDVSEAGMSPSGNNDPESQKYGVFVINEDDYMWYNDDEQRIKATSESLKNYLDEKVQDEFRAPIFIVSHLQLHASMRTHKYGDGLHAGYIFDVLNEAGDQGLNIIFLFGHNHGDGWDDYLGGSSVYLPRGDKITIARGSMDSLTTETLSFYYMNAGYVGYYNQCNEGADSALTMTSFVFDDNTLEISRYSTSKLHNLKSKGVTNSYKNEGKYGYYTTNTDVYASPQIIKLNNTDDPSENTEETDTYTDTVDSVTDTTPVTDTDNIEKQDNLAALLSPILSILGTSATVTSAILVIAVSAAAILIATSATVITVIFIVKKKKR